MGILFADNQYFPLHGLVRGNDIDAASDCFTERGVQAGPEDGPDYTKKGVKRAGGYRLWTSLHTRRGRECA